MRRWSNVRSAQLGVACRIDWWPPLHPRVVDKFLMEGQHEDQK
jgi:hypothetical protein